MQYDKENRNTLIFFEKCIIGMTARCVAGIAMIPITVLKTRFESGQYNYTKMSSALLDIYCREGFRGLCCGLTPTLVRDAPYSGLYLMFYTQLKQIMSNEHVLKSNPTLATITHFTCGLTAGLLASLVTLNFNAKNYKNTKTISLGYASRRCG